MSFFQKIFKFLLPQALFERVEAESKQWILTCGKCKSTFSVWDLGGLRYKAKSIGRTRYMKCRTCQNYAWFSWRKQ